MNKEQVLEAIESIPKPYTHIGMSQSTYSRTIRDIKHGLAKQSTMNVFFAKFGYEQNEVTWRKTDI